MKPLSASRANRRSGLPHSKTLRECRGRWELRQLLDCASLLALFCLCLSGSAWAQSNKLNLFIWSEYIDPQIVRQFEKEYDCKVTLDVYEDAESMLSKIQAGGVSLYDVVVPPDHIVPAMVKLKLLAPLRHENLPNLKNLEEEVLNPPYERGNRYT